MKDEWPGSPGLRASGEGQFRYDGDSAPLFLFFCFCFARVLDDLAISAWQCKGRTEEWWNEMAWVGAPCQGLPQCSGLIPLSPTPLNVVQHLQLARCVCVEVVNHGCWVGSHILALWGILTNNLAHAHGKKTEWEKADHQSKSQYIK